MSRYRTLGADPPFGDLRRAHGVAMEGYYWRFSDPASGRVIVALCGVCRDGATSWAAVATAAHPERFRREEIASTATADPDSYGLHAGTLLVADGEHLSLNLGNDARIEAQLREPVPWPTAGYGALGPAHWVPGLGQYWHPHLLDGRVTGEAVLGDDRVQLDGWHVYAEKNWGSGFPRRWWWGQAHGFDREDVCVAFAGGELPGSPLPLSATAIVVRIGDQLVRLAPPTAYVGAHGTDAEWTLRGRGPRHRVKIRGTASTQPHMLPVPLPAQRRTEHWAAQHLGGRLHVEVRRGRRLVFEGESRLAGLEHGDARKLDG